MRKYLPLWSWKKLVVGITPSNLIQIAFTGLAWPHFGFGILTLESKTKSPRRNLNRKSVPLSDDPVKDI